MIVGSVPAKVGHRQTASPAKPAPARALPFEAGGARRFVATGRRAGRAEERIATAARMDGLARPDASAGAVSASKRDSAREARPTRRRAARPSLVGCDDP